MPSISHHGIALTDDFLIDISRTTLSKLHDRAVNNNRHTTNAAGIILIVLLVLAGIALIFGLVVVCIIMKNKRARRARQRQLEESKPFVQQSAYGNGMPQNAQYQYQGQMEGQTAELQGTEATSKGVNVVQGPQQLDGFTAPPPANTTPVELPNEAHYAEGRR